MVMVLLDFPNVLIVTNNYYNECTKVPINNVFCQGLGEHMYALSMQHHSWMMLC